SGGLGSGTHHTLAGSRFFGSRFLGPSVNRFSCHALLFGIFVSLFASLPYAPEKEFPEHVLRHFGIVAESRIPLPAPTKDWLWTESVKEFFCSDIPRGGRERDSRKTIVSGKRKITIRTKTPISSNRSFWKVPSGSSTKKLEPGFQE